MKNTIRRYKVSPGQVENPYYGEADHPFRDKPALTKEEEENQKGDKLRSQQQTPADEQTTMKNSHSPFAILLILAAAVCIGGDVPSVDFLAGLDLSALLLPFVGAAHIELVSYSATAPSSGAAAAPLSGDSLVVKNARESAEIIAWWGDQQVAGFHQLTVPSGHDTTRGLRQHVRAGEVDQLLPEGISVPVQAQETISLQISGSATAGDVESGSMLMLYRGLSGSGQVGISWADLLKRRQKLTTVFLTLAGTAAGYTGSEAINVETDLLLANREYALLGGSVSVESATISISGPDLGNVRVGFPANDLEPEVSMNFFPRLARAFNEPIIPVINSGNRANTLVSFVQDENNVSIGVTLFLALLD